MFPLLAAGRALVSLGAKSYSKAFPGTIAGKALGGLFGVAKQAAPLVAAGAIGSMLPSGGGSSNQLPAIPTGGAMLPGQFSKVGTVPFWRGAGGKFQFPWQDPSVPQFLKAFALDDAYLKAYYRAPHGYVVVKDPSGKPYCLLKNIAKQFGLWTPAKRPPISVGDWHSYQRAKTVNKKLQKLAKEGIKRYSGHRVASPCKTRKGR